MAGVLGRGPALTPVVALPGDGGLPDVEHLVDAVRAEPFPDRGRRGDHQLTAELDLGEGHMVGYGPHAERHHVTHLSLPSPAS